MATKTITICDRCESPRSEFNVRRAFGVDICAKCLMYAPPNDIMATFERIEKERNETVARTLREAAVASAAKERDLQVQRTGIGAWLAEQPVAFREVDDRFVLKNPAALDAQEQELPKKDRDVRLPSTYGYGDELVMATFGPREGYDAYPVKDGQRTACEIRAAEHAIEEAKRKAWEDVVERAAGKPEENPPK